MTNYPFKIARKNLFNISLRSIGAKFYYSYMKIKFRRYKSNNKLNFDWSSQNFNRTALLNFIISCHRKNNNCSYLEIGCASNINFDSVCLKNKVGVDPDIGGTLRLTSDQFFKNNNSKFDLIFLDGLHTYEQTKKDLINSLNILNEGGIIVLDDFIPRNWKEHFTPRVQSFWNGDIWKIAFELIESQGIDYRLITIDGGQCVIIKNSEKYFIPDLNEKLRNQNFDYFFNNFNKLPVLDIDNGIIWIERILKEKLL